MAELIQVYTTARRLLPPDLIPWAQMTLPSFLDKLKDRYKFAEIGRVEPNPPGAVLATGGEFQVGGVPQALQQLVIEPNVVQTQVSGGREHSDAFFRELRELFRDIDPTRPEVGPEYTVTHQTTAVARLAVAFDAIFSKPMLDFLEHSARSAVSLPDADAQINLLHLNWKVTYASESEDFIYLPKQLIIEPRSGSKLADRIYFTQSPTDSEGHKRLLEIFEAQFRA